MWFRHVYLTQEVPGPSYLSHAMHGSMVDSPRTLPNHQAGPPRLLVILLAQ